MGRRDDARRIKLIELLSELENFCQLLREVRHFIISDRQSGEPGDVPYFIFCDSSQSSHLQHVFIDRSLSYHYFIRQKRKSNPAKISFIFYKHGKSDPNIDSFPKTAIR